MLLQHVDGCRVMELEEDLEGRNTVPAQTADISVHLRVPPGYTAKEVGEAYRQTDKHRREVIEALGHRIPARRRLSNLVGSVELLDVFTDRPAIYEIIDRKYGDSHSQEIVGESLQKERRRIATQRHQAREILRRQGILGTRNDGAQSQK